jgi:primosomal protein N'
MSRALNSAQQNLAKVIAGNGPDAFKIYDYLVENFSGAEFTLEDLQKDEDLELLMTPPKTSKAKKSSGRGAKTSEERAREGYDSDRCDARVWLNGFGGQCTHKKDGQSCMCTHHSPEGKWGPSYDEDGNWWLGLVTDPRPENPVRPGGSGKPKAWVTDKDGGVIEKPVKPKKPKMTDEEKEEKKKLMEEKKKLMEEKKKEKKEAKKKLMEEKKEEKRQQNDFERELKKAEEDEEQKEEKKQKEEEREFKEAMQQLENDLKKEELSAESEEEVSEMVENSDTENMSGGEEGSDYIEIIYEDVEYQQHKDTGEILDPDDFSEMGVWNAESQSIDWDNEDAEKHHESKKSEL